MVSAARQANWISFEFRDDTYGAEIVNNVFLQPYTEEGFALHLMTRDDVQRAERICCP